MAKTLKDLRAVLRIATAAFAYPLHSERFSGAVKGTFPDLYGGGVPVLTHFDFAPVALVPGTKYVIGFTVTTTGAFVTLGAGGYDPGTYAGGAFFR